MSSQLIELNSLVKNDLEVWSNPGAGSDFDYSDGSNEEQYLIDLFKSTQDLSLDSPELAEAIQDWASLYHLSSSRANLLKNINLPKKATILELGCGCGAITRYLAEQGHKVTAVEGSLKRAEIARLRNRDMNNVEVACHNFNSLELPPEHYDVILFIGVLEYAKRFSGQNDIAAEQAVIQLLDKAKAALQPDGLIIIAIENRTGLKYELGALEDHLAIPNVGIDDYQGYEYVGIKTYDYSQWQELFNQCDLVNRFYYPFPDYKLPEMVINGDLNQAEAHYLSTQINSYDPISSWTMPQPEDELWYQVIDNSTLKEKANSFGIIAAKSEKPLIEVFDNRWCLYDSSELKNAHHLNLISLSSKNINENKEINRFFDNSDKVNKSLKNYWLERISASPSLSTLQTLTQQFYRLLQDYWPSNKLVDLDQILFRGNDSTIEFGKYWQFKSEISPEQQLFHVLFSFLRKSKKNLSTINELSFLSVEQIISDCFGRAGLNCQDLTDEFIQFEQHFKDQTHINPLIIRDELSTLISNRNQFSFNYIDAQLFFSHQQQLFSQDKLKTLRQKQTATTTKLCFHELNTNYPFLRFDPCDHKHGINHYFVINAIEILQLSPSINRKISIRNNTQVNDLQLIDLDKAIYKVTGIDPQIIFSLPDDLKNTAASYNLVVKLQWLGV